MYNIFLEQNTKVGGEDSLLDMSTSNFGKINSLLSNLGQQSGHGQHSRQQGSEYPLCRRILRTQFRVHIMITIAQLKTVRPCLTPIQILCLLYQNNTDLPKLITLIFVLLLHFRNSLQNFGFTTAKLFSIYKDFNYSRAWLCCTYYF